MSSSDVERIARLDARDHEYIESLPESKRTTVVSTILSYGERTASEKAIPSRSSSSCVPTM